MGVLRSAVFSPTEVARLYGVSPATIRRQCQRGEIPAVKQGQRWQIRLDQLPREHRQP
ncbi:helix-turn-helix domain-containing protein [Isoptericola sp. b515]|uniref:helix-turn-helix domain-containing protein n=1 Tax=Isoptericola sp. b515 TaxID=3064652 RepID=UPI0035131F30